jgi:geranylgeranyl diphosphate synthase type I
MVTIYHPVMVNTPDADVLHVLRERYGDALDAEIEGWIGALGYPRHFPGMLRYQLGYVDERLQPASYPGKRVRPFLCLTVAEALRGSFQQALPAAAAIELLHNFSLIHDDIEDHDPSRHHRETVWRVWGEPHAINAGDAMFAVAGRAAAGMANAEVGYPVVQQFQDTALALTKGQYLDMSFEDREAVTADEYLEMISLKSAALIGFSAWAGAMAGGGIDRQQAALLGFGLDLGRAFQIHDDINGIWGDPGRTGKLAHTDLVNRKKTLPILSALERAQGSDLDALKLFFRRENHEIDLVLQVLEQCGARGAAERELDRYLTSALTSLRSAELPPNFEGLLTGLARQFTGQPAATS